MMVLDDSVEMMALDEGTEWRHWNDDMVDGPRGIRFPHENPA